MLKVGLTGGIGCGKSTAAGLFVRCGAPVIDTDVIARDVARPGQPAFDEILAGFGEKMLDRYGRIDRAALRKRVFTDVDARKKLEHILHPRIKQDLIERINSTAAPYCIIVVPLLIETDFRKLVDRILVIDAPDDRRVEWLRQQRGMTDEEIDSVTAAQVDRVTRRAAADDILENDGDLAELELKVHELHEYYTNLANSGT